MRLNEIYFAFLTLAFQMLIYNIILGWVSFTGGDQGLMGGIPRPKFLGIDLADRTPALRLLLGAVHRLPRRSCARS